MQKPFSLSSLVPVWLSLSKYFCTACLMPMRLSEQYVTVCEIVYFNAFFLSADISSFELSFFFSLSYFLCVVSICCLLVHGLDSALSAKKIQCLQNCPVPLLECALAQLCMADVLCVSFDMNATGIKTAVRHR